MRKRHLDGRGSAQGGGDTGNDFEINSGATQRGHLFAGAPEDQRIPAL